jgi:hypothetical protein
MDSDTEEKISIWGYQLGADTPYVRIKATESGAADSVVSAQCIKHEM